MGVGETHTEVRRAHPDAQEHRDVVVVRGEVDPGLDAEPDRKLFPELKADAALRCARVLARVRDPGNTKLDPIGRTAHFYLAVGP